MSVSPVVPDDITNAPTDRETVRAATLRGLWRRARGELLGATLSAALALLGVTFAARLWRAHLNIPIAPTGDAMLSLMIVKGMQEHGWFQSNPSLGAPLGLDFTAYPATVGDTWHLVALKVLSLVLGPAATVNVYFVLGFAVIAAFAFVALRRLGVGWWLAVALGAVYAWLPYHFLRSESHLFLSAYYAVPLAVVVAHDLLTGRVDLTRRWRGPAWAVTACAVLLAGTGLYYAAFALVLVAAAALLAALARQSWRPLVSGAITGAVIVTGLVIAALPNLLRTPPPGSSPVVEGRSYGATEVYGLKITNLLLPWSAHRIGALGELRAPMADSPIPGEGSEMLGVLGVLGLVAVLVAVLLPRVAARGDLVERLRPLGVLAVVSLLSATVAGLNGVIAVLGFANLRAWNRMSVVIAFIALAGLGLCLDVALRGLHARVIDRRVPRMVAALLAPAMAAGVALVGIYDQTSDALVPDYPRTAAQWNSDAAYFAEVQARFGAGAAVFALPYVPFPENPPVVQLLDYAELRGYMHSDLRWNYAAIKGEAGTWQAVAVADGVPQALPRIVAAGFDAVTVYREGYADRGVAVEAEIVSTTGAATPLVDSTGTLATYDLREYRQRLVTEGDLPDRDSVLYPVRLDVTAGGYGTESANGETWQWATTPATLSIVNPRPDEAKVALVGRVQVATPTARLTVTVDGATTTFTAKDGWVDLDLPVAARSGVSTVTLATDSAPTQGVDGDPRTLFQRLVGLHLETVG